MDTSVTLIIHMPTILFSVPEEMIFITSDFAFFLQEKLGLHSQCWNQELNVCLFLTPLVVEKEEEEVLFN